MTAICGGGPSGPQAGVGGVLTLGAAAIEVFISSILVLPELAPVVAPIIAGLVDIHLASYCGTDPPADPGLTASDVADAISIPPSFTTFQSQLKILQWFESRYWYQICQCNSTTTPAPSAPSNPGTISTNSGLPVNPSPCWSVTTPWSINASPNTSTFVFRDFSPYALPPGVTVPITIETTPATVVSQTVVLPTGVTNIKMSATMDNPLPLTFGPTVLVQLTGYGPTGTHVAFSDIGIGFDKNGLSATSNFTQPSINAGVKSMGLWVQSSDTAAHTGSVTLSFFCPPGVALGGACCPPDPILEGELQQILQYVQAIYAGLPIPPNSFAEGTVHSGLVDSGSVTFAGVPIALKVALTTIPAWVGVSEGDPDFYPDVGFLSFATSEGNYRSEQLVFASQVLEVPLLSGSVGYSLRNGVVASITELLAGP